VVTPKVVLAERFEIFTDHDDAGAGGIECDGLDLAAVDATDAHGFVHGANESVHLVVVGLGLEVGVGGGAVEWIFGGGGPEFAAFFVEDGDANA
jgi:hypothetical protein